ncbi:MAG: nitroreductase/quinone reductase family protein [Chloroflexota bacterium]
MLATVLTVLGIAAVAIATLAAVFVIGMRRKSRIVQGPLRAFLRVVLNPRQLRQAGRSDATTSIIRHRGRRTGRLLETPVDVVRDADDFFIALPYGRQTQWLRNVLAAGSAEIVTDGATIAVEGPELLVMSTVTHHFPEADQRSFQVFGTTDCLRLSRANGDETARAVVAGAAA